MNTPFFLLGMRTFGHLAYQIKMQTLLSKSLSLAPENRYGSQLDGNVYEMLVAKKETTPVGESEVKA